MPLATTAATALYTYVVVNTYAHDPTAFTQGLVFDHDVLFEGTALIIDGNLSDFLEGVRIQNIQGWCAVAHDQAVAVMGKAPPLGRIGELIEEREGAFVVDETDLQVAASRRVGTLR